MLAGSRSSIAWPAARPNPTIVPITPGPSTAPHRATSPSAIISSSHGPPRMGRCLADTLHPGLSQQDAPGTAPPLRPKNTSPSSPPLPSIQNSRRLGSASSPTSRTSRSPLLQIRTPHESAYGPKTPIRLLCWQATHRRDPTQTRHHHRHRRGIGCFDHPRRRRRLIRALRLHQNFQKRPFHKASTTAPRSKPPPLSPPSSSSPQTFPISLPPPALPAIFTAPARSVTNTDVVTDFFAFDDSILLGLRPRRRGQEMGDAVLGLAIKDLGAPPPPNGPPSATPPTPRSTPPASPSAEAAKCRPDLQPVAPT